MGQIKIALNSLKAVFTNASYLILAVVLFIIVTLVNFLINVLILNYDLLTFTLTSGFFDLATKTEIFLNSLAAIGVLSFGAIAVIVILSALLAIEIPLFIFYFKKQLTIRKEAGVGLSGLVVGWLGAGCSACGSIALSSLIGFTATTALIGFLPLEGLEFGLAGIFILLFSIYLTAKKISLSNNCKI